MIGTTLRKFGSELWRKILYTKKRRFIHQEMPNARNCMVPIASDFKQCQNQQRNPLVLDRVGTCWDAAGLGPNCVIKRVDKNQKVDHLLCVKTKTGCIY